MTPFGWVIADTTEVVAVSTCVGEMVVLRKQRARYINSLVPSQNGNFNHATYYC